MAGVDVTPTTSPADSRTSTAAGRRRRRPPSLLEQQRRTARIRPWAARWKELKAAGQWR